MDQQLALWQRFCEEYIYNTAGIPLFSTNGKLVNIKYYGKNNRLILKRSELMENLVIEEVKKVINDFHSAGEIYEGLIYIMYLMKDNIIIPLYIGKSEKYGKQGNNLSRNISNIEKDKSFFCRWGNNYAYHIGDLSAVVCPGHPEKKVLQKYKRWANMLFESYPTTEPTLKEDVYFWVYAWKKGSTGIFREFGSTPLTALEYQLISVAATLFPDYLLNFEGVNRGRRITWIIWITLLKFYSMSLSEHLLGIG
jgi:hypothetical protein